MANKSRGPGGANRAERVGNVGPSPRPTAPPIGLLGEGVAGIAASDWEGVAGWV